MSIEELEEILEALLIWEQMEPKTAAKTVRNRAIEKIQARIFYQKKLEELSEEFAERRRDLQKPQS